jgi:pyruvate formate lyase activating enzyme
MSQGIVFNIQRFSIHDGPGIRTTVFLKGCPLRCYWCHNPEGLRSGPELQIFPQLCIVCGACVAACPEAAHELVDGRKEFRRELCKGCGRCVLECFSGALVLAGRRMSVQEVMDQVLADRAFYETSGGGVTLSGGEPLFQRRFTRALLESCKAEGLHTAIETAGHYPWETLEEILPLADLVMMDLKHMDSAVHRLGTGVGNERILDTARRLAGTETRLLFRVPIIPGVNDTPEAVGAIAAFVRDLSRSRDRQMAIGLELLPFHPLGSDKYRSLGMANPTAAMKPLPQEKLEELKRAADIWAAAVER